MKIFTAEQIRQLDAYTIENEPIASIDLMERAALTFTYWFINQFPETGSPIHIFCGPGNNGGDGLAIARMLHHRFYDITVYRCHIGGSTSEDFDVNLGRLPAHGGVPVHDIEKNGSFPELPAGAILIDGIFGSGLNRPVEGFWAELLEHLNQQAATRVAIDIPSGLFADQPTRGVTFHAGHTFSFEVPKFAFFFPENQQRVGHWVASAYTPKQLKAPRPPITLWMRHLYNPCSSAATSTATKAISAMRCSWQEVTARWGRRCSAAAPACAPAPGW